MVGLGHLTWLSVRMVVRSPDLNQNGSGHMLYGKATFFEWREFVLNIITRETRGVIRPVAEPPGHKLRQGAKAGFENSCFADLTNLVGFHRTSGSSGRDSLRKSRGSAIPAEHSQVGG